LPECFELKDFGLVTDLYELTMAACYHDHRMFDRAAFSLFVRDYPPRRRYFVAAGLEDALFYLRDLRFTPNDLEHLDSLKLFKKDFLDYLGGFCFSGDVQAIPEGRLFFINEPVLEVEAPLIEAQIVETYLINAINLQTMIATKASRCFQAAGERQLVDFSLRRTQGVEAGLKVARASYIGGFAGTSNVLAGKTFGLPVVGTMAHSFITSFDRELDAFRAFARTFPRNTVLLLDTYDTVCGALNAADGQGDGGERRGPEGCPPRQREHRRAEPEGQADPGPGGAGGGLDLCQRRAGRGRDPKDHSPQRRRRCLRCRHQDGRLRRRSLP
jgi:nicotinate phosphoribosyltransferase